MMKLTDKIKRICSVIICLSMCMSFVTVSASTGAGITQRENEILRFLGVTDETFDAEVFDYGEYVTRAEFAQYMVRLMNINIGEQNVLYYTDIPKTHYAYDEITALTEFGYINGYGDKTFNPEENTETEHALAVILRAMGCGEILKSGEGNMVYTLSSDLGLTDKISSGGDMTYGTMFRLFCNAIFAECYGRELSDLHSLKKSDKTLLYMTRDMKHEKSGMVTAADGTDIEGGTIRDGYIKIDGEEYKASGDMSGYIGRYVEYIYSEDSSGDRVLEWVYKTNRNTELVINVDSDCEFDAQTFTLRYRTQNDKTKVVSIPAGITLIYNGAYQETNLSEYFGHTRYRLTLVQNEKSDYSLAIIDEYDVITVDKVRGADKVVYGKNSEKLSLEESDYTSIKIFHSDGSAASIDDIAKDNTLCIYRSADVKKIKIYITNKQINGKVDSADAEENEVVINGTAYEFYAEREDITSYIGKNMILYLDMFGYVAYCEIDKNDNVNVGFMFRCQYNDEDEVISVRIFNEDGKVYRYNTAQKVTFNETSYKTAANLYNAMKSGASKVKPQIIAYKINSEQRLTEINTAHEDDGTEHALTVNARAVPLNPGEIEAWYCYYSPQAKKLGRTMGIDPDKTVIFKIPGTADIANAGDEDFSIGAPSSGLYPSAVSYRTTSKGGYYEEYVVIEISGASDDMSNYGMMFDSSYTGLNKDDEVTRFVRFADSGGNFREVEVDGNKLDISQYNLKRGDIFKCALNAISGKMTALELLYQPGTNTINEDGSMTAEIRNFGAYVYDASENGMKLGYTSGSRFDEIITAAVPVVLYDKEKNEIIKGTYSDLKTFKTDGKNCSFAVVGTNYVTPLVVYAHR